MEIRPSNEGYYKVEFNMAEREIIADTSDEDGISRIAVVRWLIEAGLTMLKLTTKRK